MRTVRDFSHRYGIRRPGGQKWVPKRVPKGSQDRHSMSPPPQISFDDFRKVEVRLGRIVAAEPFPQARKPAYRLTIDFGPEIGVKKSSAQITKNYMLEDLPGRLDLAVVNFPPRQIG